MDAEFAKESDRGCAILMVCLLEETLAQLFSKVLPSGEQDAKHFMPRGRLSVGVGNAKALGLIDDDMAANFKLVLEIRNTFAHKLLEGISFQSEEVRSKVNQLRLPAMDSVPEAQAEILDNPRKRYTMAVDMLFFTLERMIGGAARLPHQDIPKWTVRKAPAAILQNLDKNVSPAQQGAQVDGPASGGSAA